MAWGRQPYCHTQSVSFSPFSKGEMLSVFFTVFFESGSVSFVVFFSVFLFLGPFFEKFFGSELMFWGVVVGVVCFDSVLPMFLLYNLVFRSRRSLEKILFMSGLVFSWVRSLFFWFFRRRRLFVFFERESLGSNRAHHTRLCCFFLFLFCPAALVCSPFLAVRPASWCFPWGAILGPTRCWDSPGTLLRPFFWTRGSKGVLVVSFCCFCFFHFCCVLRLFHTN